MKTEYLYVILNVHGACWRVVERKTENVSLPALLEEGWRPVRETPYGQSAAGEPYILICLEREPQGSMGFGFASPD
jgi:hypothetical protein